MGSNISKNGRAWSSDNSPKIGNSKSGKNSKNNFFRTLEINQRLAATKRPLETQEKWLHVGKNSELCGVLTCTLLPFSSSPSAAEINRLHFHTGGRRLKVFQSFIPKAQSLFDLTGHSLEDCTVKAYFYSISLELAQCQKLLLSSTS